VNASVLEQAVVAELSGLQHSGSASIGGIAPASALAAEAELIARAQQYDSQALSEIYESFYPRIYHYLYIQLGNSHLAEDLASDVMLQVLEAIDRYRIQGTPFAAWVFRIARNRVIDHHRRRSRRPYVELEDGVASESDGPDDVAERNMEHASVRTALADLTEEQRQVILLKFMENLDNAAVAQVLGRSLGAVKSLQHRALVTLRTALEKEGI
jgi:RNA polymerase sigma-70 factor (ECF subfamily)